MGSLLRAIPDMLKRLRHIVKVMYEFPVLTATPPSRVEYECGWEDCFAVRPSKLDCFAVHVFGGLAAPFLLPREANPRVLALP